MSGGKCGRCGGDLELRVQTWRCRACLLPHEVVVDKGGPGDQEKVRYETTLGRTPLPEFSFSPAPEGLTAKEEFARITGADTPNRLMDDLKFVAAPDAVTHPSHYTQHPSGIECIQITEHMSFTMGNAMKYLWRADLKNGVEDLKKAVWYIQREIAKREKA